MVMISCNSLSKFAIKENPLARFAIKQNGKDLFSPIEKAKDMEERQLDIQLFHLTLNIFLSNILSKKS